ncbi:MAG: hypothetical protein QOH35_3163 [Acidobacteriaceae bacterium]|jgi:hypothetical protein|nr:hypothetical protein [Acidobacteriaceae bacterium]
MSLLRLQHRQAGGAILGILLNLLPASAAVIPSQAEKPDTTIVFYAQPKVSEDLWPVLFQVLRSDLADGQGELPSRFDLDKQATFLRGTDDLRGVVLSRIISVKLLGRCDVLPQTEHPSRGPLGWVPLVSRTIQPFISIDCTRIAQVLRPAAAGLSKQDRQYMMDQAIAHVLIHEWNHIETQSARHSSHGISQAYLSLNDLIEEPRGNQLSVANR